MTQPHRSFGTIRKNRFVPPSNFLFEVSTVYAVRIERLTFGHVHLTPTFANNSHDLRMGNGGSYLQCTLVQGLSMLSNELSHISNAEFLFTFNRLLLPVSAYI